MLAIRGANKLTLYSQECSGEEATDGWVKTVVGLSQVGGCKLDELVGSSHGSCTTVNGFSSGRTAYAHTKCRNNTTTPCENAHGANVLSGQGILNGRHEGSSGSGDQCAIDGSANSILWVVSIVSASHCVESLARFR